MYKKRKGDIPFNQNSVHDGCVPYSSVVVTNCEHCSGWKVYHPFCGWIVFRFSFYPSCYCSAVELDETKDPYCYPLSKYIEGISSLHLGRVGKWVVK